MFLAAGPNFVGLGVTHKSDEPSELQVKDSHEKANNLSASANKHKENLSEEKEVSLINRSINKQFFIVIMILVSSVNRKIFTILVHEII